MPNAAEELDLTNVFDELKKFESVSKELQKDTSNKMISRLLFDELLQGHLNLQHYLSRDSEIVLSPVIETAISKYQSKEEFSLAERSLLQERLAPNSQTSSDSEASTFLQNEFWLRKFQNLPAESLETCPGFQRPPSVAERFFSVRHCTISTHIGSQFCLCILSLSFFSWQMRIFGM